MVRVLGMPRLRNSFRATSLAMRLPCHRLPIESEQGFFFMAKNKKAELIDVTYRFLKKKSPDDITIRMVGSAAGCTSTTIYRHFENLDELVAVAATRFLEDYIFDLGDLLGRDGDSLETIVDMWRIFADHAFANAEIFELLFFGRYREALGDAIIEYYHMFPEKWQGLNGVYATVLFGNNLMERNRIMMHRAATDGYFPLRTSDALSDLQCYAFHGVLMKYKANYRDPAIAKEGAAEFMKLLKFLIDSVRLK